MGNKTRQEVFNAERGLLASKIEKSNGLAVHADGKKMNEHGEIKERFPVVLTGFEGGEAHVVEIPTVPNGQGETMAKTTERVLKSVNAQNKIVAVVGDTTSSMSGIHAGMFRKLEDLVGNPLLKTPCRHHSHDLLVGIAFKTLFGPTKAPARTDFLAFRKEWKTLKEKIPSVQPLKNRLAHPLLLAALDGLKESCNSVLHDPNVCSNRKELAEQQLIVNGFLLPG